MFSGFTSEMITFLDELGMNNNKTWFEEHKQRYQKVLKDPFAKLIEAMAPAMMEMDPQLETDPKRCIARIHRDVRFAKDKSPYRTNLWLAFKRPSTEWKQMPAWYFEVFPDHWRYGMGFFDMPRPVMELIRTAILGRENTFMKLFADFNNQTCFTLEGEAYKRTLNPDLPPELQVWNQKKELWFKAEYPTNDLLFSEELPQKLIEDFKVMEPMYQYLYTLYEIYKVSEGHKLK